MAERRYGEDFSISLPYDEGGRKTSVASSVADHHVTRPLENDELSAHDDDVDSDSDFEDSPSSLERRDLIVVRHQIMKFDASFPVTAHTLVSEAGPLYRLRGQKGSREARRALSSRVR